MGSGHRTRVESAVGEIIAKLVLLVGHYENVVSDALGETRDFGLDREMTGIGPPRSRDKGPGLLLHDPRLELLRRMADVPGEFAVPLAMADDQQQVLPALRDEVLDESVGEHRPARKQMQNAGAAILAAQAII